MNYKLRIYKLSGYEKGKLDHEEFFETKETMDNRYGELFRYENYSYNPTAWQLDRNEWKRIAGY